MVAPTPPLKLSKLQVDSNGFQWDLGSVEGDGRGLGKVKSCYIASGIDQNDEDRVYDGFVLVKKIISCQGCQAHRLACVVRLQSLRAGGQASKTSFVSPAHRPYVRPNKPVLLFWSHSRPFLDCRTSFERRLDSNSQLLAIIDIMKCFCA
ncbi:hypothetical protein E3N88_19948 [Mikania micrantha]|uniref:Uncharacterized protein n=1 Tax=Mikania micrantha TaxID=192012 RepID=A0A5N6NI23_9ASTR|nr:hypothetical protein E3N88_19948 [Mikania micrantha]